MLSTGLKLSKAQINKIIQWGGFLSKLLGPLLKKGSPLIKNKIKSLAKSVLIPLGLSAAASAVDAEIHKKNTEIWKYNFNNNFKWRNEWYYKNCASSWRF